MGQGVEERGRGPSPGQGSLCNRMDLGYRESGQMPITPQHRAMDGQPWTARECRQRSVVEQMRGEGSLLP